MLLFGLCIKFGTLPFAVFLPAQALPASATGGGSIFFFGSVIFSLSLYTADCYPVRNIVVSQRGVPQKGETFGGEDEGRSECVFAAGGNKRYEATEDEERS